MRTLVWFRGKDLRLADHVPLQEAIANGPTFAVFVVDPYFFAPERARLIPNRMQFLVDSLAELATSIASLGSRLLFVPGKSVEVIPELVRDLAIDRVVAHRWTEPVGRKRDALVKVALGRVPFDLHEGETLAAPGQVLTGKGTPFSVFGPFSRAFAKAVAIEKPLRAPRKLPPPPPLPAPVRARLVDAPTLETIGVMRNAGVVEGGERAAHARLRRFIRGPGDGYDVSRNLLGEPGTSRLSQDLKFGTLSPRAIWHAVQDGLEAHPKAQRVFLNELVWRELAYHVLWHHPEVLKEPFRPAWKRFPWRKDEPAWKAWVVGKTGYPVVDASARQLLATGFVHNRARMISASFLAKHLLLDFRRGEDHYLSILTDGDWASNDLGWQWATGSGVDAQPWFRVFNPILQGEKFDPAGTYVRTWVPELAGMPNRWLHRPWEAPAAELAKAGIVLGKTYPGPIVDHAFARKRFLAAAEGHLGGPRAEKGVEAT